MSSPNTLQDFHNKALVDYGITDSWPEAVLKEAKVKKKLILGLIKILIKNTKLHSDFVWVYLEDLLPDQMIEYGEVLPKSGQEKKWFNSLSPSLRKRLKKMEK